MRNIIMTASVCLLLLVGCATATPPDPEVMAEAKKPLMCSGSAQCDLYWQRAQFWIASNSAFKIQNATDTIIETYSPTDGDTRMGYQARRERLANGKSRIWLLVGCANMFGCAQRPEVVGVDFKSYVRGNQK